MYQPSTPNVIVTANALRKLQQGPGCYFRGPPLVGHAPTSPFSTSINPPQRHRPRIGVSLLLIIHGAALSWRHAFISLHLRRRLRTDDGPSLIDIRAAALERRRTFSCPSSSSSSCPWRCHCPHHHRRPGCLAHTVFDYLHRRRCRFTANKSSFPSSTPSGGRHAVADYPPHPRPRVLLQIPA